MSQSRNKKNLTFGERAVGLGFNPAGDPNVQTAKEACAQLVDMVHDAPSHADDFEEDLRKEAIMQLVAAQMAAVKFLTFAAANKPQTPPVK